MSYTVLARRYRPETFDDVVGQEAIARTLKNAIGTNRVAHAYLFTGTRGVGKTTMARILAKALNCLAFDDATTEPCCKCESCVGISEGEDIDVLEIDGASNTGVEHIRELRQNAIYRPARSRYKIYIIDEVHMLSTSAFNALLKTLEEPPEHVKFIFATTEANKILPTILSRCQRFDFRNIQPGDITSHLMTILKEEGVEAEEAAVRRVARLANGSMRDSLSLLDQLLSMAEGALTLDLINELLGVPRSEMILTLAGAIAEGNTSGALEQVDQLMAEGLGLEQLIEALQQHFRDLLVLSRCGGDTELVDITQDATREAMLKQLEKFEDGFLVYGITVTEELRRTAKMSGAGRALLEAAIVRLSCTEQFADTKILLDELKRLGGAAAPVSAPAAGGGTAAAPAARGPMTAPAGRATTAPAAGKGTRAGTTGKAAGGGTSAGQGGIAIPEELTLGFLQMNWPKLLAALGRFWQMKLGGSHPTAWENHVLVLSYPPKASNMKMLADHASQVREAEEALSRFLKQKLRLQLREDTEAAVPTEKKTMSDGAKPSQKEINDALNDPVVKDVQKILGGKVKRIAKRMP